MSHRKKNWFELSGVSRNRGFEKSGVKLQSSSEVNPRETRFGSRYREVRETEGSRNRDSTVGTKFSINIPVASCPEYFSPPCDNPVSEGLNVILHITGKIIGYLT